MKNKKLWTEISDEQAEKLVGGHPQGDDTTPGAPAPFGSEPALTGFANANPNGQAGLIQGFVVHSPTCLGHKNFH